MKKNRKHALPIILTTVLLLCSCAASAETEAETEENAAPVMEMSLQDYAEENSPADDSETSETAEPIIPDGLDRAVIGEDNRLSIVDTNSYPFSAVAYMIIHTSCGCDSTATGFVVGKRTLLTSAQALCCQYHGGTAETIGMYFGYKDGNYAYTYGGQIDYWYGTSFEGGYTKENMAWDYGIIHLYDDIGLYTGTFGIKPLPDYELDGNFYQVASYRDWDGTLTTDYGTATVDSSQLFSYDADMEAGYCGSPVFDKDNYVVGIAVGEDIAGTSNWAVRITNSIVRMINESENL